MHEDRPGQGIFTAFTEAKILTEAWRMEYNQVRPRSALRYRPPAPDAIMVAALALHVG